MSIDSSHPLYDILRNKGVDVGKRERELSQQREEELEKLNKSKLQEEEFIARPKEYDEVLDFIEDRWDTYLTVKPARDKSIKVTRSELLNLAMKTPFRGKYKNLLGAVIDIRERDIIANKSYEGIGLESVKIDVEEIANASREYVTSKGVSDMDKKLLEYDSLRFIPEVFKVDRNNVTLDVGFNKIFKFTTFCQKNELPDMSIAQPKLIARCYLTPDFRSVTRVEMRKNSIDRLDFEGTLTSELKTYDDLNIPLDEMEEFFRQKRDISLTDIIDVNDEDIRNILVNKSIGGHI